MATKVNLNIDLDKIRKKVISESVGKMKKILRRVIINESILKGISPVKGKGKFESYSDSYKTQIKSGSIKGKNSVRPVNLRVSGELLKSFFVEAIAKGFKIGFDNDLADIHNNKGAGKSKIIRRMLPTETGERFNRKILKAIEVELSKIIREILRRRPRS